MNAELLPHDSPFSVATSNVRFPTPFLCYFLLRYLHFFEFADTQDIFRGFNRQLGKRRVAQCFAV